MGRRLVLPESVDVELGYNPSHIGGLGDLSQSILQAFGHSISDYDLNTILMQLHEEVKTQKILLVGHSQGTFYTNELYNYLTTHGVPKESIAVYNIATPASFVAGGGQYITSTNDRLINSVRDAEVHGNAEIYANTYYVVGGVIASALRGNITIPKEDGWEQSRYGGHGFQVYMRGAAARMLADMQYELGNLKSSGGPAAVQDGCFDMPQKTVVYRAEGIYLTSEDAMIATVLGTRGVARDLVQNSRGALVGVMSAAWGNVSALFRTSVEAGGQAAIVGLPEYEVVHAELQQTSATAGVSKPSQETVSVEEVRETGAVDKDSGTVDEPFLSDADEPVASTSLFVNKIPERIVVPPITNPDFGGGIVADVSATQAAPPDTTPPDAPVISVEECTASLSASTCLTSAAVIHVSWASSTDAVSYSVSQNGVLSAPTSSLADSAALSADTTTQVVVVAYDAAGNTATSSIISVTHKSRSLIINEIGWGGTQTAAANQWMELKNVSGQTLDLAHVSVGRTGGDSIPLSGSMVAGAYLVLQRNSFAVNAGSLVASFPELGTATAEKLTLLLGTSTVVDETPDTGACTGWCAGALLATVGSNATGIDNLQVPLSMERISDSSDGSLPASWRDTDSYGPYLANSTTGALWGTPGGPNSEGLPESGVYCGASNNLVQQNTSYTPDSSGCVYLMKFITGGGSGVDRYGALYKGDVTNSTGVNSHLFQKALASFAPDSVPGGSQAGDHFFFAMWEKRTGPAYNSDNYIFNFYFTQGASSTLNISGPPHGNYVTIPWIYQP